MATKRRLTKAQRAAFAEIGSMGGRAIAKKLGKDGMSKLGKRGSAKRWPKKKAE